jgi:hypothetical protein
MPRRPAIAALLLAPLVFAGCATFEASPSPSQDVVPFSAKRPGAERWVGWRPWIVAPGKSATQYELVVDPQTQRVVVQATAVKAASGLQQRLDVDPATRPQLEWDWRLPYPISDADLSDRYRDDSPARVLLFFDGDRDSLPARERTLMETASLVTGQAVPYATLVYAWDNRLAPDTVVPHAVTRQVKTVVVGQGPEPPPGWQRIRRHYVDDYRRAFGAEPGRLIGVGILTDADNTGSAAVAYYGDIRLLPPAPGTDVALDAPSDRASR